MHPAVPPPHLPNDAGALLFVLAFFSIALPKPNFSSPLMKLWLAQHPELHLGVIASRLPFEAPPLEGEGCAIERG